MIRYRETWEGSLSQGHRFTKVLGFVVNVCCSKTYIYKLSDQPFFYGSLLF